jgi:hypothetical protein
MLNIRDTYVGVGSATDKEGSSMLVMCLTSKRCTGDDNSSKESLLLRLLLDNGISKNLIEKEGKQYLIITSNQSLITWKGIGQRNILITKIEQKIMTNKKV